MSYYLAGDTIQESGLGKFRFRPGKALKRFTHVTPKSFTLKKIMGAVGSFTGTVLTGGLGPIVAPKVFSANSKTMQALGIGATAIAAVAGGIVLGPAIALSLGPKLAEASGMLGKGVEFFGTGASKFFNFFQGRSASDQQTIANRFSADQIAQIERGQLDPNMLMGQGVSYQPQQSSFLPAPQQSDAPYQSAPGPSSGLDMNTLFLIGGIGLVGVVLMKSK